LLKSIAFLVLIVVLLACFSFGIQVTPWTNWVEIEERAMAITLRLGFEKSFIQAHFKSRGFLGNNGKRGCEFEPPVLCSHPTALFFTQVQGSLELKDN
jgi:hypothetical protein